MKETIQVCVSALKYTLFRTFKNIVMNLMKYRFGKENIKIISRKYIKAKYIKQIDDTRE